MNKQNTINTVFFDLFGVLLGVDQSVVIQYLSRLIELPYEKTRRIVLGETYMRFERGEINFNTYINRLCNILPHGDAIDKDALKSRWVESRVGEMPAVSLLKNIQQNVSIWIISNTSESHINVLAEQFNFLNDIDGIVTSERAKAYKPSPIIFNFALAEANTNSSSSIFIDDCLENVDSAKNIGFQIHLYSDYKKLNVFLNEFF
jgi:FMN phosphatase YigB (HAD superfamily)